MNTELGIVNLWAQGDWVTRCVAVLLLIMSVASWAILAVKALNLWRLKRQAQRVDAFWSQRDWSDAIGRLGDTSTSPFAGIAEQARTVFEQSRHADTGLEPGANSSEWVTRCLRMQIETCLTRIQSGLSVLASVGSTAPFVGLFGTVWGIYHALMGISVAGQATIDKVAGPIGEALIMTALGLAVAIPAVLGYNALVRGNRAIASDLNRFAHDLHAFLILGQRLGTETAGPGSVVRPVR